MKTAFLNASLDEETYMEQPTVFIDDGNENKICKLEKSIYGLKQSPRQWNMRFHEQVEMYGFVQNPEKYFIYISSV